jgi:SAM-dependent methyltransferase
MAHSPFAYDCCMTYATSRAASIQVRIGRLDGNLPRAIESVTAPDGKRVLDLGTDTGRLPLLFASRTAQMAGLDLSRAWNRRSSGQSFSSGRS